ncbi:hypothetical protein DH2020_043068 [Rehmannia glutinosa]|uniref:NAC domain-containing protein n=1 Tax=Rehmannia glutinosa TaxID=99300 RepID=A0ABR0ULK5_REHGL
MENNNCGAVKRDDLMELPPGFRFHPTDEELITHYLSKKVVDGNFAAIAIGEVDMNKVEPWELPCKRAKLGEKEWYFFCVRDKKYPTGLRTNRATAAGYWKATGKDKEIFRGKTLVGMKKTLVFTGVELLKVKNPIGSFMNTDWKGNSLSITSLKQPRTFLANYGQNVNQGFRKERDIVSVSQETGLSTENSSVVSNLEMGKKGFEDEQEDPVVGPQDLDWMTILTRPVDHRAGRVWVSLPPAAPPASITVNLLSHEILKSIIQKPDGPTWRRVSCITQSNYY